MGTTISRRAFLKLLSAAGVTGLGFRPFSGEDSNSTANDIGRVTVRSVSVYARPSDKSQILFQRYRDELVNIYYEVIADEGPAYNPVWYRVWGGYMHRANVVRSQIRYNPVAESIPETGQLGEVTVPFTQAMRYTGSQGWETLYRLYNSSAHWVHAVEEGPDGEPWYKLIDELLGVDYHVPARHLRMVQPEEFAPISPDVPQHKKKIEVINPQVGSLLYRINKKTNEKRIYVVVICFHQKNGLNKNIINKIVLFENINWSVQIIIFLINIIICIT